MKCTHAQASQRAAYTLVEMLLVIGIIAVLIAMLLPAIFGIRKKAKETETRTEIAQLSAAIQAFQSHYRVPYLPSYIVLCENEADYFKPPPERSESYQYLKRLWPRLTFPVDWNGNGSTNDPPAGLHGDECLVFFLGGIPAGSPAGVDYPGRQGPPKMLGFSTNASNPAQPGGNRVGPFFNFDDSRLIDIYPETNEFVPLGYYSYQDPYRNRPDLGNAVVGVYAYFSAYGRTNGYNPVGIQATPGVAPYASVTEPPADWHQWHYLNPNSFQIISPGADGRFGMGSMGSVTINTSWSPSTASNSGALEDWQGVHGRVGADDISNFYDKLLGVSE